MPLLEVNLALKESICWMSFQRFLNDFQWFCPWLFIWILMNFATILACLFRQILFWSSAVAGSPLCDVLDTYMDAHARISMHGYPCMDIHAWVPKHAYPYMDSHAWISIHGYPCMVIRAWISMHGCQWRISMHGYPCMDIHPRISMHGYPCMVIHAWIAMHEYPCIDIQMDVHA